MRTLLGIAMILMIASSAAAKEYFKVVDPNGVETWLDDKSRIPPVPAENYRYVDKNGVVTWVNDIVKVPQEYRNQVVRDKERVLSGAPDGYKRKTYVTKVRIEGNQVIVPVTLKHKGRKIRAKMLLDPSVPETTLYSVLAKDLKLGKNKRKKGRSARSAKNSDSITHTTVDFMEVDGKIVAKPDVAIKPYHSNIGADGILGDSFTRFFQFSVDQEKQLLKWN